MVVTTYVNTTVIMTMTATTTMIMAMAATKTMIMIMIRTMTKNMTKNMTTTMTRNITTSMTTLFKQVQKGKFFCLLKKIMNAQKGYENQICTSSLKNRCFLITQYTKFIGSALYY